MGGFGVLQPPVTALEDVGGLRQAGGGVGAVYSSLPGDVGLRAQCGASRGDSENVM